ncbi:MAG: phosphoglycerate mutase [Peptococcaceae bacterium BRH_c4b]|nr:MAG: phosphoglycerate mutase [Peptococcaceae bacterium BRH_c4b]
MKYVIILGDGMADYGCPELGNRTPLEYARTPNMDFIASRGVMGLVRTVPDNFPPGSDVANLSVMGYDPVKYYTGRSPLEAVSMGVKLEEQDVAFRCNLVTLSEGGEYANKTMVDYSAGEISTLEARELIAEVNRKLADIDKKYYAGVSYRHLMVWSDATASTVLTPPHDISGKTITDHLPREEGAAILLDIMKKSNEILSSHPANTARREKGMNTANSLWFWGQGKRPFLPKFTDKYGIRGAVISAVDLIRGIGICAGLEVVDVHGATGNIHTDFRGKALAALATLRQGNDFVYIHIEAPDEAGHQGDLQTKLKAIEEIDEKVIGTLLGGMEEFEDYRLMVLPDHPTPMCTMTHATDPVPFAVCAKTAGVLRNVRYDEKNAAAGGMTFIKDGYTLMDKFIGDQFFR